MCLLSADVSAQTISTIAGNPGRSNVPAQEVSAFDFAAAVTTDPNGVWFVASRFSVYRFSNQVATRVAGTGTFGPTVPGRSALTTRFLQIGAIAVAANGDLYIGDESQSRVYRVRSSDGIVEVFAGGGPQNGVSNVPATNLTLSFPNGLEIDSAGRVYVKASSRIYRVDPATGIATHLAGNGVADSSGESGPATATAINCNDITVDAEFNVYCAENSRIRRINPAGTISVFAGTGVLGTSGNGGPALNAQISAIDLAVAGDFLYFAGAFRVRSINLTTTIVNAVAGTGTDGFSPDGTAALSAQLRAVQGLAASTSGGVFVIDVRVARQISAGVINTVAFANAKVSGIGGSALAAQIGVPLEIARDPAGNIYFATSEQIFRVTPANIVTLIAGSGIQNGPIGDNGPAVNATLQSIGGIASDGTNLYISQEFLSHRIRVVNLSSGIIANFAGTGARGFVDNVLATSAQFDGPSGLLIDSGFLFVADSGNRRIRRIALNGPANVTTVAGNGSAHSADGPALTTGIGSVDLLAGSAANLYFGDGLRVRKVVAGNVVSVAGNGSRDAPIEGGVALEQPFGATSGLAVNGANVFLSDSDNHRIWMVNDLTPGSASGQVNGFAGDGNVITLGTAVYGDFSGDGGPPGLASINTPAGLVMDGASLVFADSDNARVRRVQGLVNAPPTLIAPVNQTVPEDSPTTLDITIGDDKSAPLSLIAQSSNNNIVQPSGLTLVPVSDTLRRLTIVPQPNAVGATTIALRLVDGDGGVTRRSFTFTTTAVNDPPTLDPIANVTATDTAAFTALIAFSDPDGPLRTFTVSSSNQTVLPDANIAITGVVSPRTLTMTPIAGIGGTTTVTVTLSDGTLSTSRSFLVTITATVPRAPELLNAVIDGAVAELAWNAPSGGIAPTAFRIDAGTASGTTTVSTTVSALARRFVLPLPSTGSWFVRVHGIAGSTVSPASNEAALTVTGVPGRPRDLMAAVAGNVVTFRWTLPTNGTRTSYRLESGTATGLSNLSPVPIASTATSVTLNAATATTFVRLVAVNAIGASAPSNEVQLVVGATPATPFTPTDVRVAVDGFTAVFHWSASAGATATQFVLDAGANTPGVFNLVSGIPFGNGFTFAASAPAGTYNVRLRAVNAAGSSLPAGELFVTLPAAPAVATAPALLRANVEPNRTVTLAWAPPLVGVATSYVVEAGSAAGLANLAVLTVGPAPSLQVVAPPGSYFVRVRAVNSAGTSAVSNEIVVTVP